MGDDLFAIHELLSNQRRANRFGAMDKIMLEQAIELNLPAPIACRFAIVF